MPLVQSIVEYGIQVVVAGVLFVLFIRDRGRLLRVVAEQGDRISGLEEQRVTALTERHGEAAGLLHRAVTVIEQNGTAIAATAAILARLEERCPNVRGMPYPAPKDTPCHIHG